MPQLRLALDHLRSNATAAVAIADCEQRGIMMDLAAKIAPGGNKTIGLHEAVIASHRIIERVRQHAAAIEPFPPEEVGGHLVGLRPVDLDRKEAVDPALLQKLWQGAGKAEA